MLTLFFKYTLWQRNDKSFVNGAWERKEYPSNGSALFACLCFGMGLRAR